MSAPAGPTAPGTADTRSSRVMTAAQAVADGPAGASPGGQRRLTPLFFLLAALALLAFVQWRIGGVSDKDGFYHLGHAALYAREGPFSTRHPFAAGIIGRTGADIWYGFHLFLIPFTLLRDPGVAVQVAAVSALALSLVLLYFGMRRLGLAYSWAWPFLLVVCSPVGLHLLLKARPHALSVGLAPLLAAALIGGGATGVFLAAAALAWLHASFVWVVPLLAAIVLLAKRGAEKAWDWRSLGVACAGAAAGLLFRPHLLDALRVQYVQLVTLQLARHQHLPIDFGLELDPLPLGRLFARFPLVLLSWLAATVLVAAVVWLRRQEVSARARTILWTGAATSTLFLAVSVASTYRAAPLWLAFTTLFVGATLDLLVFSEEARRRSFPDPDLRVVVQLGLALFLAAAGWYVVKDYVFSKEWRAAGTYRSRAAALWIRDHSRPGEVVANVSWDTFPELFVWSPENRYLWGMDPIFLYAGDPGLLWGLRRLHRVTDDLDALDPEGAGLAYSEQAYRALALHAGARYVVFQVRRLPWLNAALARDSRFVLRFSDQYMAVYEVPQRPPSPRAGAATPDKFLAS